MLVVDLDAKTWKLNDDVVFPDVVISQDHFYVEGTKNYLSYVIDIFSTDMTYRKVQWLNAFSNPVTNIFTGQCKIMMVSKQEYTLLSILKG